MTNKYNTYYRRYLTISNRILHKHADFDNHLIIRTPLQFFSFLVKRFGFRILNRFQNLKFYILRCKLRKARWIQKHDSKKAPLWQPLSQFKLINSCYAETLGSRLWMHKTPCYREKVKRKEKLKKKKKKNKKTSKRWLYLTRHRRKRLYV